MDRRKALLQEIAVARCAEDGAAADLATALETGQEAATEVSRLFAQLRARSVETACAEQATGTPKRPRLTVTDAMAQAAAASPRQAALEGREAAGSATDVRSSVSSSRCNYGQTTLF